jgi:hypothetical protein
MTLSNALHRRGCRAGFAEQQVGVLGHNDISTNAQGETAAGVFQATQKQVADLGRAKIALVMVTTEGEKVRLL